VLPGSVCELFAFRCAGVLRTSGKGFGEVDVLPRRSCSSGAVPVRSKRANAAKTRRCAVYAGAVGCTLPKTPCGAGHGFGAKGIWSEDFAGEPCRLNDAAR